MGSADLAGRIDTVERRMDSMELRWDASFAELSTRILQSNSETREAILATLRGEVAGEFAAVRADMSGEFSKMQAHFERALGESQNETRSYMRVLYEDILSRIALLGEGRPD